MYYELETTFNGYCYKDEKAFKDKKGVCYIPEYNTTFQDYDTEYKIPKDKIDDYCYYTYDDIRKEVNDELLLNYKDDFNITDEKIDKITEIVFDMIDWQSPSSLLNELDWSEDLQDDEISQK